MTHSAQAPARTDVRAGVGAFDYRYDSAGRLTEVIHDGITAGAYRYDWTGRRVWRTVPGMGPAGRAYVYDLDGRLLAEHEGAGGQVVREYVWIDDMPIAVIDAGTGEGTVFFLHVGPLD